MHLKACFICNLANCWIPRFSGVLGLERIVERVTKRYRRPKLAAASTRLHELDSKQFYGTVKHLLGSGNCLMYKQLFINVTVSENTFT